MVYVYTLIFKVYFPFKFSFILSLILILVSYTLLSKRGVAQVRYLCGIFCGFMRYKYFGLCGTGLWFCAVLDFGFVRYRFAVQFGTVSVWCWSILQVCVVAGV